MSGDAIALLLQAGLFLLGSTQPHDRDILTAGGGGHPGQDLGHRRSALSRHRGRGSRSAELG
jgi:hypothetical protein